MATMGFEILDFRLPIANWTDAWPETIFLYLFLLLCRLSAGFGEEEIKRKRKRKSFTPVAQA
jgi:hypothetical protein